jgi:hypothetical protein
VPVTVDTGRDQDHSVDDPPALAHLHGQGVGGDEREGSGLVEGPVAEGLDLLVQVGGHPGHLRLRQAVDAQLLDELVHPAGAHPGQITVRHHRDQRRLGPLAPLEQPLGEVRPGAQLGDRDVDRADPGVQVAVPVAVALRGPVRAALAPLGTDHRVGVGGQQRVDHRLQQVAHEVRGGFRQGLAKQAGRVDNVRCGHRDAPFESAVKGSLEDHAVAAPRLLRRGRQPRYTIIGDSTGTGNGRSAGSEDPGSA